MPAALRDDILHLSNRGRALDLLTQRLAAAFGRYQSVTRAPKLLLSRAELVAQLTQLLRKLLDELFVLAAQCMSTLAAVKRESGTWRWPLFMLVYMNVLAYVASLIVYQGGRLLGFV
jgi:Fe2+ transport system protein B